jgi:hypothetical protein
MMPRPRIPAYCWEPPSHAAASRPHARIMISTQPIKQGPGPPRRRHIMIITGSRRGLPLPVSHSQRQSRTGLWHGGMTRIILQALARWRTVASIVLAIDATRAATKPRPVAVQRSTASGCQILPAVPRKWDLPPSRPRSPEGCTAAVEPDLEPVDLRLLGYTRSAIAACLWPGALYSPLDGLQ